MSSIRLFILSSFAEHGAMHGHRLRLEAEKNYIHLWTDISVGAVYGAMKRLASEGLLRESGREQEGNRPPRQLFEITEEGRRALSELRNEGLREVWFKYDPFDLALTRVAPESGETLPLMLAERLKTAQALLSECKRVNDRARPNVGLTKQWALRHTEYRLEAEVRYLTDLLAAADDIVCDERGPGLKRQKS